ncbi:Zn-dependent protease (includes SpoIVFB) [Malonomonas rubra DSM 5091]|uniref:Zn-dependent protease (Includes SpoIVFB) n=1 Tax=Malonomonas rubra DSM 5091 TaxID=1122189 RepID=A0A1M6DLU0_MALRU|nr:site-2 protease family protein [Malonomonas rubra]SHI74226.1 Zn-dependent protease (includes SpoIVFB) [Malonomonas rubra DSM 5091]
METIISKISIMLVPALLAITMHEVAHGYAAERFGDPTARLLGRLNLNPMRHLDPIGTVAIFIFGFGWARPVPVNAGNLRHPKRDMIWVAFSGPVANLLLAVASALLLRGIGLLEATSIGDSQTFAQVANPVRMMLGFSLYINVLLGIFNLVPLPPLDGGRILVGVLPEKQAMMVNRLEPFGFILILFLVFFTDVWSLVLAPLIGSLVKLMAGPEFGVVQHAMSFLFGN